MAGSTAARALRIFIVAGETSGDILGGKLMHALRDARPDMEFLGVGGECMIAEGLASLFPMRDIAVMGFLPVIRRLPTLLGRISYAARACIAAQPDALIIIDSPDFTHRVAKKVRRAAPGIPIIDYVSPTVWGWRPGRAKAMRAYVDHLLAVLPFEPAAHQRLGGPPCTYVGHPLTERLADLRPDPAEQAQRDRGREILLLPGSRMSEVSRLLPLFRQVVQRIAAVEPAAHFTLPVAPHVAAAVQAMTADWPVKPRLTAGEAEKYAAFRRARAALAASGTVTLELGLSAVPMVVTYKASPIEAAIVRAVVLVSSVALPNLILDEKAMPELLQQNATPEKVTAALLPLIRGGAERDAQMAAFGRLDRAVSAGIGSPSGMAAAAVLAVLAESDSAGR